MARAVHNDNMSGAKKTRIALVDDQPLYLEMLSSVLGGHPNIELVLAAAGAAEARANLRPGMVDVAILDVDLADGNGVGLGISLRRADPNIGIMLLSSQDVMELLLDLPADVRRGWSYLSKTASLSTQSLVDAIEATARGETVLDGELVRRARPREGSLLAQLSKRQYEVLQLVAQGLSNTGVAEALEISARSVENHLNAIYTALEIPEGRNARVSAVLKLVEESSRA